MWRWHLYLSCPMHMIHLTQITKWVKCIAHDKVHIIFDLSMGGWSQIFSLIQMLYSLRWQLRFLMTYQLFMNRVTCPPNLIYIYIYIYIYRGTNSSNLIQQNCTWPPLKISLSLSKAIKNFMNLKLTNKIRKPKKK